MTKHKVMIGMSGGVDSSVAAALLLQQNYEVLGVTMQIWEDETEETKLTEGGCCSLSAVDDARRVADTLGIPYYVLNFKRIFQERVVEYFVQEYGKGRTPNPCIACNRYVKFEALLQKARAMGADYVATGHYARITKGDNGRYKLLRSKTRAKDQTYALYNLTQEQLAHTLMPCGDYEKDDIREMARELHLPVANKPDSQEICFIPDNDYASFIRQRTTEGSAPGFFINTHGEVVGQHQGIANYTVGQRKGLGLALGSPVFVVDIDVERNLVIVGDGSDVFRAELYADDLNWISIDPPAQALRATAKIRYSAPDADCCIYPESDGRVRVVFDHAVRAITPGQAVVFYHDDEVLGGGTILQEKPNRSDDF